MSARTQHRRTFALLVAMTVGAVFNSFFCRLEPLTPWLIFGMLFFTFSRVSVREMRLRPLHLWLTLLQIGGSAAIYAALAPWSEVIAQGTMICVLAPTATASMVIAGMLGADLATMATFNLLCNLTTAAVAPVFFSLIGTQVELPFWTSFAAILTRVFPVLVLPFASAWIVERTMPRLHEAIRRRQGWSFYLWAVSLTVVMGRTAHFIASRGEADYGVEWRLAAAALVVCLGQFALGRWLGRHGGDTVAGGQSLGQKNTVLAIWMAQTYLLPLASVAPAAYVVWQNLVNSWQLWRHKPSVS